MKKLSLTVLFLCFGAWLLGENVVVIVTPGQITVGSGVHFRFDYEGGAGSGGGCTWNFGDGRTENSANNQAQHAYMAAGAYTVTCTLQGSTVTGSVMVNVIDTRRISPQGRNNRLGRRTGFQAENFVSSSLRWDFGDGTVESGPRNHVHVYAAAGTFTVKAWDNNGDSPTFSSCQVTIEGDNRQVSATPPAPRANQSVAFSAQNFPGGSLRWDFGDGTTVNGGPGMNHVYGQPGNFQVRVWDSAESPDTAVGMSLPVAADNRQLQVTPSPARANLAVNFSATNFAGSSLKWSYGDGKSENGGPQASHVYASPGNFQVRVWEASADAESALKATVSVQPDVRQINISGPPEIFEGTEVVFEGRNFGTPSLKWDFGDGIIENAGARQPHRFQRPGNFVVRVVEADTNNLPVERRIQVLNDNRSLVLKSSVVFSNSEFEIEAQNFRGGTISWDFGDGPVQSGPRLMKHRYNRIGSFRVRAVDFAGRDGKFVERNIQVENDSRLISLPGEIIAGEEVAMKLLNAGAGSFLWKFSDGDSRSGLELSGKSFRSPGPNRITVVDPSGKFPPLEKTIQVLPDTRTLKGSAAFILPKEEVAFSALNFKGPGVRWDFGDGMVKENGQLAERHVYGNVGRYQVKAVDFNGRSSKSFTADVVVADMTPGFEVETLELTFDNGKYYRVIAKNSPGPGYQMRIKARGRGVLSGQFLVDNMSIGLFQMVIQENRTTDLPRNQMVALPAIDLGLHKLTVKFTNYDFNKRIPFIKYFVSAAGAIQITAPAIDAKVPAGDKITLRWAIEVKKPLFEIAVSAMPFQFLDDKQIEWRPVTGGSSCPFDPGPFKPGDWIYWQVRLLNENKQVQTTSEIASFRLGE